MKIMIAADIHGSALYCRQLCELFKDSGAQKLLLLGDILYHGPRNALPRGYDPKKVCALLNPLRDSILCVRGNCDSEVDQMVLDFSVLSDSALLFLNGHTFFAAHGHLFTESSPPPLADGDILLYGHTHVPKFEKKNGHLCINPGSVSIPKENSPNSCIILKDSTVNHCDLYGHVYMQNDII